MVTVQAVLFLRVLAFCEFFRFTVGFISHKFYSGRDDKVGI